MPGYPGVGLSKLIHNNQQAYMAQGEVFAAGQRTLAYEIAKETGKHHSFQGFAIELAFAGAPGVFEVDVQGADTDDPAFYATLGTVTAVNAANVARFQQAGIPVKYITLLVVSLANPVAMTAKVSR